MRPYCRYFYSFCLSIVLPLWCHFCFYKVGLVPANCLPKMSVCIHTSYYVCICFYFQTKKKFHSIERVGVDKLQPKLMFLVLYFHFIFYLNTYWSGGIPPLYWSGVFDSFVVLLYIYIQKRTMCHLLVSA